MCKAVHVVTALLKITSIDNQVNALASTKKSFIAIQNGGFGRKLATDVVRVVISTFFRLV